MMCAVAPKDLLVEDLVRHLELQAREVEQLNFNYCTNG